MKFTLNRDLTVCSVSGHAVAFKKGVATFVPKSMHHEVLAIGAVAADPDEVEFDDQVKPTKEAPADPAERAEMIRMALADIKARNAREEFTATGVPKAKTVVTILGFEVSAREIGDEWQALLAAEAGA